MTTWAKSPEGKILKTFAYGTKVDVSIAKNYLKENELQALWRLVNAYLDIAKDMAERHIPMTSSIRRGKATSGMLWMVW